MRTIRTKVYQFAELNEAAKQTALTEYWDINIDYDWYSTVYADANNIGLTITSFDIDGQQIEGDLDNSLTQTCYKIMANHGEICETYKTAQSFLNKWNKLVSEHSDGINTDKVCEDKEYDFDQLADELENQFKQSLLEDYLIMLRNEYENLTIAQAIQETIEAKGYEFTKDGKRFNR